MIFVFVSGCYEDFRDMVSKYNLKYYCILSHMEIGEDVFVLWVHIWVYYMYEFIDREWSYC